MKKIFLIIAILRMPFAASAQGYKGFIDIFGGTQFGGGIDIPIPEHYDVTGIKNDLAFGLNVTGGYQITNFLFAGVGFGGYTTLMGGTTHDSYYNDRERVFHSFYFPIFADVRWTLDIERKVTPFVDLKVGYQFAFEMGNGCLSYYSYNYDVFSKGKNGAYFMPSVGVRFGKASGFNLGIAYNATVPTKLLQNYEVSPDNYELREVGKTNKGVFMITFGADF